VAGATAAVRRFTDSWYDRCGPFTWTKPADEILAKAIRKETLFNLTLATPASILTSLFLLADGCNPCSGGGGCCCTDHVRHTERIDLCAFNRAASAD
jgi:hypothetical protein